MDLANILDKRFALRSLLKNEKLHLSEVSIPKDEITIEKEPDIRNKLSIIAKQLIDNILRDIYEKQELVKDWLSLEKKIVLEDNEILSIDARSRPGHKILDNYMPHFWDVKNHLGKSVRNMFTQEILEKALITNLCMHSTPYRSEIRRMITMTGGMGNVTKYRASTSKAICQYFKGKRIFDPCVGWGGRMLGSLASSKETYYIGCEPDENTYKGLMNILEDSCIPSDVKKRARIINKQVELTIDIIKSMEKFDIILTSPPYFNLEIYTSGEQSTNNYPTWDIWVLNWLKPLILNCLSCLNDKGVSCWSVKNFKSDKKYPLADVVKEIHNKAGWKLIKTVVMNGSGRPGAKRIENGKESRGSEEETFCFRKDSESLLVN